MWLCHKSNKLLKLLTANTVGFYTGVWSRLIYIHKYIFSNVLIYGNVLGYSICKDQRTTLGNQFQFIKLCGSYPCLPSFLTSPGFMILKTFKKRSNFFEDYSKGLEFGPDILVGTAQLLKRETYPFSLGYRV